MPITKEAQVQKDNEVLTDPLIVWNKTHNEPSEIMKAVQEMSYSQVQSLALSLTWKVMTSKKRFDNIPAKLWVKKEVARANMRPPYKIKEE